MQFTCEMDECWAAYPGVPSSTVEAIGMGGTLYLLAGKVFMENCSLIDNSGSAGSSDIFQDVHTYLSLTNTNLSADASKSKSGFITSLGTLLIDNVYITSLFAEGFVLLYQSELEKMVIKDVQVVCAAFVNQTLNVNISTPVLSTAKAVCVVNVNQVIGLLYQEVAQT